MSFVKCGDGHIFSIAMLGATTKNLGGSLTQLEFFVNGEAFKNAVLARFKMFEGI